jgi:uncharacterized protein
MQLETRHVSLFDSNDRAEFRLAADQGSNRLVGYAAVYGKLSHDLGGFRERIVGPEAFRASLANGGNIRALVDHDGSRLIGSTANNSLRLYGDDPRGLRVEIDVPDTSWGRDILTLVRSGESRSMSFGFRVRPPRGQRFTKESGETIRELLDIDLKEVSVLALPPAYSDTSIAVRSAQIDPDVLKEISEPRNASQWDIYRRALVKG